MNAQHRPIALRLQRPAALRMLDRGLERAEGWLRHWRAWAAEWHARHEVAVVERQLARLDLRTLNDIGGPACGIGQRRAAQEHEARKFDRLLDLHGW